MMQIIVNPSRKSVKVGSVIGEAEIHSGDSPRKKQEPTELNVNGLLRKEDSLREWSPITEARYLEFGSVHKLTTGKM